MGHTNDMIPDAVPLVAARLLGDDVSRLGPLPSGRHGLSPTTVAEAQKARLFVALAACVARNGYHHTTIRDVCTEAGVSRKAFYALFPDLESLFCAVYETIDIVLDTVAADIWAPIEANGGTMPAGFDVREFAHQAIRRYLDVLDAERDLTWLLVVEAPAAGDRVRHQRIAVYQRFSTMLAFAAPGIDRDVLIGVLGGINELVLLALSTDRNASLTQIAPAATALLDAICFRQA